MDVLNNEYGWLEHRKETCHYNPYDMENKSYYLETYGIRDDVMAMDGFYSHDYDYTKEDL